MQPPRLGWVPSGYIEREIFDSVKGKALLKEWGLSESLRGVGAIALGYPVSLEVEVAERKLYYPYINPHKKVLTNRINMFILYIN